MAIFEGKHINADYGDLQLTEELQAALHSLDMSCRYGCGGTWDVYEEIDPDLGDTWRAVFTEMATDELVFDKDEGVWTDGYDEDDDDCDWDDEDEDEDNIESAKEA